MRIAAFTFALLISAAPAAESASLTFVITDGIGGVTVSGSGAMATSGLGPRSTVATAPIINGSQPALIVGPTAGSQADRYINVFEAPFMAFGTGFDFASSGSGDRFGFSSANGLSFLLLPLNYQSGAPLSGASFFPGSTVLSLGLTTGTTTYSLINNETIELLISGQPVPAPPAILLLAPALGALALARRKRA